MKKEEEFTLGDTIRRERLRKGMKQKALAEECYMSAQHLSHIECGRETMPSEAVLRRISNKLGLDFETLLEKSVEASDKPIRVRPSYLDDCKLEPNIPAILDQLMELPLMEAGLDAITFHLDPQTLPSNAPQIERLQFYRTAEGWEPSSLDPGSSRGIRKRRIERKKRADRVNQDKDISAESDSEEES